MQTKIVPIYTPSHNYEVMIGNGLLKEVGALCAPVLKKNSKVAIITDETVGALYATQVQESFIHHGYDVCRYAFPAGEASKTPGTLLHILNFLAENQITRKDMLLALGGGVVGDITGFAAATYLRGMPYIQLPTTLLAAIDSSVGGKTAVNLPAGKNLMGAFYQPALVVCDTDTFATLPANILADGMAEAVKYGVLASESVFALCGKGPKHIAQTEINRLVETCVTIKADVVAQDEKDTGVRQCLNLGHTIGHAIERCSNYAISHGAAIGIGLYLMSIAAVQLDGADAALPGQIKTVLQTWNLPIAIDYSVQALYDAALHDKKRAGAHITIVVPLGVGRYTLKEIPVESLSTYIEVGMEGIA